MNIPVMSSIDHVIIGVDLLPRGPISATTTLVMAQQLAIQVSNVVLAYRRLRNP